MSPLLDITTHQYKNFKEDTEKTYFIVSQSKEHLNYKSSQVSNDFIHHQLTPKYTVAFYIFKKERHENLRNDKQSYSNAPQKCYK